MMQQRWKSLLDPQLANALTQGNQLTNVSLAAGVNVLNHLLGKMQQGWIVIDNQGTAIVYRSAPFNSLTLTLTASAPVVVSIYCF